MEVHDVATETRASLWGPCMSRRLLASFTTAAVVLGSALIGVAPATAADPPGEGPALTTQSLPGQDKVGDSLSEASGTVTAFVELTTPSGVEVAEAGGSAAQVERAADATEAAAADVVPASPLARSAGPRRLAVTTNLVSGTLVTGDAEQIRALADDPTVKAIYRVAPKTVDNKNNAAFTKAVQTWQDTGVLGTDVTIGIVDTGLDYTHADFGGPGTLEAYAQAYGEDGTAPIQDGLFDPTKFAGGYDFAGTLYDASGDTPGSTTIPAPDPNPIDASGPAGGGHGTHVSGTAAGFGVLADGSTFRGDYSSSADLADLSDWIVGPGTAPGAILYALKVFGDLEGSTDLVVPALDWAADPNGDHDFNDRLDVVNMSLGGSGAPADDPENLFVDALTALGTVVVMSAGNSGDTEDIAGSPGNAASGITVASSVGIPLLDAVEVVGGSAPAGSYAAQNSQDYAGTDDVTAPVAFLGEGVDGCTALTAEQAAAVAGKIAYLWWDDDSTTRLCGSAARFNRVAAAGAVGVLLNTEEPVFSAGIAGNAAIPGAQLTAAATDVLDAALKAGDVTVHLGPSLAGTTPETSAQDLLSPFSSRGTHGALGWTKPDVAAPGQSIQSAASATGNHAIIYSGTSMAAPHVTGIAALVREAHPTWDARQVKSAITTTATHDVTTGAGGTGEVYGPAWVGTGRVDALAAVQATTVVVNTDDTDQTSVSFGVVPVGDRPVVARRTVTVTNTGTTPVTYATSFLTSTTTGGASITATPASLTLAAGASGLVTLTLNVDPATLARDIDPTQAQTVLGVPRDYVSRLSGRLLLTSGSTQLRVAVQAVPRPYSELTAAGVAFADPGATTANLDIAGRGLTSSGWYSLAAPFNLVATSDRIAPADPDETSPSAVSSSDLSAVGWASTAPELASLGEDPTTGMLNVGIATHGPWASIGLAQVVEIDVDADSDGTPETYTLVEKYGGLDLTVATSYDVETGDQVSDSYFVNEFVGDVDTGIFDGSTLVVPLSLGDLGITPGMTPSLTVITGGTYGPAPSGVVDAVGPFTVDPYNPPLWFESNLGIGSVAEADGPTSLVVHKGSASADTEALVLFPHNETTDTRAQVVDVTVPQAVATTTTLTTSGGTVAGATATLTAAVSPAGASGTVTFLDGTTSLGQAPLASGVATLKVALDAGSHSLTAAFAPGSAGYAASTSSPVTLTVAQARSTTSLSPSSGSVPFGTLVSTTVTVVGKGAAPVGSVELREGARVVATATLSVSGKTGTAKVTLPRTTSVGTHRYTAVYTGSTNVAASTSAVVTLKVTKAWPSLTLSTPSWTVTKGAKPTLTVRAAGVSGAPAPTGSVQVFVNLRRVATVSLVNGTGSTRLPAMGSTAVVFALYSGDAGYQQALTAGVLRVR